MMLAPTIGAYNLTAGGCNSDGSTLMYSGDIEKRHILRQHQQHGNSRQQNKTSLDTTRLPRNITGYRQ